MKQKHIVAILVTLYLLNRGFHYVQALPDLLAYHNNWQYFFYMAVWFFGVVGLVRFISTGWRSSQLLQIYLVFIQFGHLLTLTLLLVHKNGRHFQYLWLPATATVCTIYCLIILRQAHAAVVTPEPVLQAGQQRVYDFRLAPIRTRLANYLLDVGMLILTSYLFREFVDSFISGISISSEANQLLHRVFWPLAFFVYYLFFETIIGTSFGKLITNTVVVDEDGKRPSFGRRLGRTLCRLIPFDCLTFLFNTRGWHDSFSGTCVTQGKYEAL